MCIMLFKLHGDAMSRCHDRFRDEDTGLKMRNYFPQDLRVNQWGSFALKNSLCFINDIGHPARSMSLQRGPR